MVAYDCFDDSHDNCLPPTNSEPELAEPELKQEPEGFGSKSQEAFGTEPNRGLPGYRVRANRLFGSTAGGQNLQNP